MSTKAKPRAFAQRLLALFCALVVAVCMLPQPAQAKTRQELQDDIARLKGELETIQNTIDSYDNQIANAAAAKQAYQQRRVIIEELYEACLLDIEYKEAEIEDKQLEIADMRQVIYDNEQLFHERLVAMYKSNNAGVLSTLLSVNSFSDFLLVYNALKNISQHDTDLLEMLDNQKRDLEEQQVELEGMLEELQVSRDDLNNTIDQLSRDIAAQDQAISSAEANKQAQEALMDSTYEELEEAQKQMQAVLAAAQNKGSTSTDGSEFTGGYLSWPVPGFYYISCNYGSPDPNGTPHRGMDIATGGGSGSINGATVVAASEGTVIISEWGHYSYGNYIVIDHGGGIRTLYAHLSNISVSAGTYVSRNDPIGAVGSTGFSTGPHLHLEVHKDGGLQNPYSYLTA